MEPKDKETSWATGDFEIHELSASQLHVSLYNYFLQNFTVHFIG